MDFIEKWSLRGPWKGRMPLAIDHDQHLTLAHRWHIIGKPAGPSTVSWDYEGQQTHQVTRPDDGQPARRWQVSCAACGQRLEFAVHGVQATRRRQARRRAFAWAGLVVLVASVLGCFVIGGDALPLLIGTAVAGAAVGYYVGGIAADEMGITGPGTLTAGTPGPIDADDRHLSARPLSCFTRSVRWWAVRRRALGA